MWKTLNYGQNVCVGDKIRYNNQALADHQKVYKVERTDQYYFVISPEGPDNTYFKQPIKKVVRHFDIGYHINLELWTEHSVTENAVSKK